MAILPPIGMEIPCSSYAMNVPMQVPMRGVVTLYLRGGWRVRVEENISSGLGGVRLKIIGMEWTAESPVLGTVTISQSDVDTTPLSLLEVTDNRPVYRNTMFLDFTVTIEKPPLGDGPLVLSNTKTATVLNSELSQFPPQGDGYEQQELVDLASLDAPKQVVAQLLPFTLTVTQS